MKIAKSKHGISLVEIVVAINLTAMLMALLCGTLPMARRQLHETEVRLGGALLAQNVLEEYMTVPLEDWPTQPFTVDGDWRKVQLSYASWESSDKLMLATVVVLAGPQERYRLETVIFP